MSKKRKALSDADHVLPTKKSAQHKDIHKDNWQSPTTSTLSQDTSVTEEKLKKKKKKDKEKEFRREEEVNGRNKDAKKNSESIEAKFSEDPSISQGQSKVKKKKKDKKQKEVSCDNDANGTPSKSLSDDHAPAEIASVDTDILKQASVNLGLPMADDTPKDMETPTKETKKKKKKKKKEKKEKGKVKPPAENDETNPDECALNYLRLWYSNRKAWKFNKRYQVRLIHNMYKSDKLADDDFEPLLLYLDGMQGKSRDKTRDDAEKIVAEESEDKAVQERARQVFQMLS